MASEQVWVVAACFNEEDVITRFIVRGMALPDVQRLLLIDDGSADGTVAVIQAWQRDHPDQGVTLLELTRNFGKEAAMLAGLVLLLSVVAGAHAHGRLIGTLALYAICI